jgi:hypothetical protein
MFHMASPSSDGKAHDRMQHHKTAGGSMDWDALITSLGTRDDPHQVEVWKKHGLLDQTGSCTVGHVMQHVPLSVALVAYDKPHMLDALFAAGANVHAMFGSGINDLTHIGHVAAGWRRDACLDVWIRHGGDVLASRRSGLDPQCPDTGQHMGFIAAKHGNAHAFQRWVAAGGDVHSLFQGCGIGYHAMVNRSMDGLRMWCDHGGDIHAVTREGWSLGHAAGHAAWPEGLSWWLDRGGDPDVVAHPPSSTGRQRDGEPIWESIVTPLSKSEERARCFDIWCRATHDIYLPSRNGFTVGRRCAEERHAAVLNTWIAAGGNLLLGDTEPRAYAWLLDRPHHHPRMVVTVAAIAVISDQRHRIPASWSSSLRDPEGRRLAEDMIPYIKDPLHLATWCSMLDA